jgi:MYXO-CTERM domain-containing protein
VLLSFAVLVRDWRMHLVRRLAAPLLGIALGLAAAGAHADLPPPDGQKFVGYAFQVQGLSPQKDWVLLAFPYSASNGRPTEEYAELADGKPVSVGRRGGSPKLYAMKRADYETFKKGYKAPQDDYEDPALRALFASDKVVRCDAAPSPVHQLPKSDAREDVVETLTLVSIDAKACHVVAGAAAAPVTTANPTATPVPDGSAAPIASGAVAPAPTASSDPTPKGGGCAGCSMDGVDRKGGALAVGLGVLALVIARRGRRGER